MADAAAAQRLDELRARVVSYVARHALFSAGERVLVACSGGVDSLAALGLLSHERFGLDLVVGHVDHGLRPESAADGAYVARIAESLDLPAVSERLDLAGEGLHVSEARAREARLAALERLADEHGADRIVLAHTASDQLETILMRLVRGAGLRGLAGIAPRRGRLVRPLLPLARDDTEAAVAALGWRGRRDSTNRDERFLRNRIRHDLVPLLERENPAIHRQAFRTAEALREDLELLRSVREAAWSSWIFPCPGGWRVQGSFWRQAGRATRAELVRALWSRLRDVHRRGELGWDHVTRLSAREAFPGKSGRVDLPSAVAVLDVRGDLFFLRQSELRDPGDVSLPLPGPGLYGSRELGWEVAVSTVPDAGAVRPASDGDAAERRSGEGEGTLLLGGTFRRQLHLRSDLRDGEWPLVARNPRSGDRVQGPRRRRRVVDLLARRGVPGFRRKRWPLLALGEEILWIPGCWAIPGLSWPGAEGAGAEPGEGGAPPPHVRALDSSGATSVQVEIHIARAGPAVSPDGPPPDFDP